MDQSMTHSDELTAHRSLTRCVDND